MQWSEGEEKEKRKFKLLPIKIDLDIELSRSIDLDIEINSIDFFLSHSPIPPYLTLILCLACEESRTWPCCSDEFADWTGSTGFKDGCTDCSGSHNLSFAVNSNKTYFWNFSSTPLLYFLLDIYAKWSISVYRFDLYFDPWY